MRIGSLFAGIGGMELGLERAGLGPVAWQCEIDPYCRAVLARHWPDAVRYPDVRGMVDAPAVDLICGGFPCQPHSVAGKRGGTRDARWLWPEYARVIALVRPRWVVVENVPGLRTSGLRDVLADLARLGFDADWTRISASEVGAPHWRQRLLIVAHSHGSGLRLVPGWFQRACGAAVQAVSAYDGEDWSARADPPSEGHARADCGGERRRPWDLQCARGEEAECEGAASADPDPERELQPSGPERAIREWARHGAWRGQPPSAVRGVVDGLSEELDGVPDSYRVGALGNAVVPAVAEVVGRAIVWAESQ